MKDQLYVAITEDGAFRVVTANLTATVRQAVAAQGVTGKDAVTFGELLVATAIYRLTMAHTMRVQGVLKGSDSSKYILADSHPEGWCRGLVRRTKDKPVQIGKGALLQMMRTLASGELHQGVVELEPGASISDAMMTYFQQSEQLACQMEVCCEFEGDELLRAGGYVVELLPEAPEYGLAIMTARLETDFGQFPEKFRQWEGSPTKLRDELLYGMDFSQTGHAEVTFGCECSRVRVLASLGTIGVSDLQEMIAAGETVELSCDYCGTDYRVAPEELRGLLSTS